MRVRHGAEVLILAEARLGVLDHGARRRGPRDASRARDLLGRRYEQLLPFCDVPGGQGGLRGRGRRLRDPRFGHRHRAHGAGLRRGRLPGGRAREPGLLQAGRRRTASSPPRSRPGPACTSRRPTRRSSSTCEDDGPAAAPRQTYTPRVSLPRPLRQPADLLRHAQLVHPHQRACANSWWRPTRTSPGRRPRWAAGRFGNWLAGNIDWSPQPQPLLGHAAERLDLRRLRAACTCPPAAPNSSELTGAGPVGARPAPAPRGRDHLRLHRATAARGTMRRTPEVIDCWFDSGSMPFAQYHYPLREPRSSSRASIPADFISEGIDQTRGWFYTMLVIGTFLTGRSSYKSCLVNELILDKQGQEDVQERGQHRRPHGDHARGGRRPAALVHDHRAARSGLPTRFDRGGRRARPSASCWPPWRTPTTSSPSTPTSTAGVPGSAAARRRPICWTAGSSAACRA